MPAWPSQCGGTAWWPVPASGPCTPALSGGSAGAALVRQSPTNTFKFIGDAFSIYSLFLAQLSIASKMFWCVPMDTIQMYNALIAVEWRELSSWVAIKSLSISYLIQENPCKRCTVSCSDEANHISNAPLQGAGVQTQLLRRLSLWGL